MCGIAGAFLPNRSLPDRQQQRTIELLQHRGPDGTGVYRQGDISLIHTRLSIIDLTSGGQPLFSADRQLVLVANGEIYNYLELRAELEKKGYQFQTHSDCEVLLYLYQENEQTFLNSVLGMFAFALWDNCKQQLVLARDRLGIKPLFYRQAANEFYFASELKALAAISDLTPEVNPSALIRFLSNNFISGTDTILNSLQKVMPGQILKIQQGRLVSASFYWSLAQIELTPLVETEALEYFDDLMKNLMQIHMRSDVPFGLFLSGGLDSSILLALLSQHSDQPIATFSAGFPHSSVNDELPVAANIAQQFGAKHTVLPFTEQQLLQRLPKAVWAADELMGDYANLPTALMSEQAARQLKVIFSGEGGDEVFAGYGRYRPNLLKRLRQRFRGAEMSGFRSKSLLGSEIAQQILSPALRNEVGHWNRETLGAWRCLPGHWSSLQKMQGTDMQTWLADDLLVKADRMMMAYGLEGRVPFLDHRVVEFGLALPDHLKICKKTGKYFLRKWAERYFPKDHLYKHKKGFTVPVRDWLAADLLTGIEQLIPRLKTMETYFDPRALRLLLQSHRKSGKHTALIWAILQFMLWHQIIIEQKMLMPDNNRDPLVFLADLG